MLRTPGQDRGYRNLGFGPPSFAFEARHLALRDVASGLEGAVPAGTRSVEAGAYGPQHRVTSGYSDFGARDPVGGKSRATIQLVFSADNYAQVAGILNQRSSYAAGNTFSIGLSYVTLGLLYFDIGSAAGSSTSDIGYAFSLAEFPAGSVINLVFCVDTLAGSVQKILAFANGKPLARDTSGATRDATVAAMFSSTEPLLLGRVNHSGTLYFSGSVFCARVWPEKAPLSVAQDMSADPHLAIRPRRIWVPQAGLLPTLSLPTYTPGSLTATGFRPRVTAT